MTGPFREVAALAVMPNGDLIAGGSFTAAGGGAANCIARWDGSAWAPVGTGLTRFAAGFPLASVAALAVLPNGDLIAGGSFTAADGVFVNRIARWNGSLWLPLGEGSTERSGASP